MDQSNEHFQGKLVQLRCIVNDVNLFTQRDECIDFLTEVDDKKAFLLVEGALGRRITPLIHDIPQLDSIYFISRNPSRYEQWIKEWVKVKGVHAEITSICQALQHAAKHCDENETVISFLSLNDETSSKNLNQLEPTFMYTQIFKEILLKMDYDEQSIKNFTTYCRNGDNGSPVNINRFETKYHAESAIWWYTYPSFVYSLLNCALRLLEAETIINMGFFIRDLDRQIEKLHRKQITDYHDKSFVVYRGQALSITDFEKLRKSEGGLIVFNNFLSTSTNREVSLGYAMEALTNIDKVGILFRMSIDHSVRSASFAAIREVSYFQAEEEILFSMHTVFRIGEIEQIDNDNPLYQVEIRLTPDDDPQLRTPTEYIQQETSGEIEPDRLGHLLLTLGQFNKAEKLYSTLLEQTSEEAEKAYYYHYLGHTKVKQGEYEKAAGYYEKVLEICQKTLPPNHPSLGTSYNNIGSVYHNMGEYSKALSSYEKDLEIRHKTLPANHLSLGTSYNNIGLVYNNMGEYSKALLFYEKALEICQKTLLPNHLSLGTSYNNMGSVYDSMGEYSKALSYFERALDIWQHSLPHNHPQINVVGQSIKIVKKKLSTNN